MKILVINTGSSSIKYQLFDMNKKKATVTGLVEKIAEDTSILRHNIVNNYGDVRKKVENEKISDHDEGLKRIVELLLDPEWGVIKNKSDITAVGHRVVHGGESFQSSTIINEAVIESIKENIPLAPLHNPPNLKGIEVAKSIFPDAPQVAVFDTAFHQSIPPKAYLYALPYELYTKNRVRRYGFHGTSHAFVAKAAAMYLKKPLIKLNLITIHLGNGASMAAIKEGRCVDTSMGLTPLEGLVMGTRSGDVDPALPFFLAKNLHMSLEDINQLLNKDSGMKGLCGLNDMREIEEKAEAGDERSKIALEIYAYRIKKYMGAYYAILGRLDAVIFTAGIGENSPFVRNLSCTGMEELGILVDREKNQQQCKGIREVNLSGAKVKVLVIPTNEEKRIAQETERIINKNRD